MALDAKFLQLMQSDYWAAQKLRFLLAHLFGYDIDISCRDFLLQANDEERAAWIGLQMAFAQSKGQDEALQALAQQAHIEYWADKAYEEGRVFAQELLPAQLIARGVELRYSKNPYWQKPDCPEVVQHAWSDGFQCYLEIMREESW